MPSNPKSIADIVQVKGRFLRSVNIEKDFAASTNASGYVVTPNARKALRRIHEGIDIDGPCRAMTLTGPYGVGKSAFALFLSRLLCAESCVRQEALDTLAGTEPELAQAFTECSLFENKRNGLFPILVTARRAPAPLCILEGIANALSSESATKLKSAGNAINRQISGLKPNEPIDTRIVLDAISVASSVVMAAGYPGVVIILDELGKLFEYAARDPRKGDVYVLQELAEWATRSGDKPLLLIGLLHQGFDEYARHLDVTTRQEWAKIQGRFTDVAFQEPTEQTIRLIASAISYEADSLPSSFSRKLRQIARLAIKSGIKPPALSDLEFEAIVMRSYPLHPAALVALPILFNRFAQNERSLFSYLSSLEPDGFQEFIRVTVFNAELPSFIRLSHIFDYFTSNFGAGLYRQPHARRWLETADAVDREETLGEMHRALVKTVGVLGVLNECSHLRATREMLAAVLDDQEQVTAQTESAITLLTERSLLTYRKFNNTFRVWEGSDIDVEERIAEGERKVGHSGLAEIIGKYLVTRPLVARRHSFETGALRYFDLQYVDSPDEIRISDPQDGRRADGSIIVCLSNSSVDDERFRTRAIDMAVHPGVLVAIPQQIGDIRAVAMELAALRWTWENTPELRDDRVARREVALRISEAEQLLQRNITGLLDPRPEPIGSSCLWYAAGKQCKVKTPGDVSIILSVVCDAIYSKTPRIRNELISRRSLSAAAAGARRTLIERMLTHQNEDSLGIVGFPPERSMYESVLMATGLHRQDEDGNWRFLTPGNRSDSKIIFAWNCIRDTLFDRQPEPIPLTILFADLASPPYGVMPGLHPVLLCAFMLTHPDETTLYREGTFLPVPGIADFEVLMRRPELFAVAGSRVTGARAAVVERLAKGLDVGPATVPVVRSLFRMVKALPDFAWNTRRLPDVTLAMRDTFQNAKSPEQFLYKTLPEALNLPAVSETKHSRAEIEAFFSALNESLNMLSRVTASTIAIARDILLESCGLPKGEDHWTELRGTAVALEPAVTDPGLSTFLKRVTQSGTDSAGIESVLALVANRPPRNWSDSDVDRFPEAANAIGKAFKRAAHSTGVESSADAVFAALTPKDRKQADALAKQVRRYVLRSAKGASSSAVRAAIMRVMQEIEIP